MRLTTLIVGGIWGYAPPGDSHDPQTGPSAPVAQSVERVLGKDEVMSSNLIGCFYFEGLQGVVFALLYALVAPFLCMEMI